MKKHRLRPWYFTSAPLSELPSNISTLGETKFSFSNVKDFNRIKYIINIHYLLKSTVSLLYCPRSLFHGMNRSLLNSSLKVQHWMIQN